ncbi:DUF1281 domain-containing protein [Salmonella enterica]|nr:DUF1281 domain-containing protein [Salmonella enterica]
MPNWCANKIELCGADAALTPLHALLSGEVLPAYDLATRQSIRLFLAGCGGLLRPVSRETYAPCPALVQYGAGSDTAENRAFTEWLRLLKEGVALDALGCGQIAAMYQAAGLSGAQWAAFPEPAQALMGELLLRHGYDWGNSTLLPSAPAVFWAELETPPQGRVMDLMLLTPPRLDVELNGFNGKVLSGVESAYGYYNRVYGIKWPQGHDVDITREAGCLRVDFDTPWSPPSESVIARLAREGGNVYHYYCESGSDYCGMRVYEDDELACEMDGRLEYSDEEDEDGCRDVTGPDWLMGKVPHFGG